jgi:RNA polymerase sigma-70 factor (ECF subfamily)
MRSEKELLSDALRFDEIAMAEIYNLISPGLYRYALRMVNNPDIAEECVAEAFSRFIEALKNGGGPQRHLKAYLYRIAHNWIMDYFRAQPPTTELDPRINGNGKEPAHIVFEKIEYDRVRAAMALLSYDQQQVILLKYIENRSTREIAAALNKSEVGVRVLHHRGVVRLKQILLAVGNTV